MLDIHWIREHESEVRDSIRRRGVKLDLDALLACDTERRTLQQRLQQLQEEQHAHNRKLVQLKDPKEKGALLEHAKRASQETKKLRAKLEDVEARFEELMLRVPNRISDDTPDGVGAECNQEIRRVGEIPTFDQKPQDHVAIGTRLGILDLERGVKLAGARGYVLLREGAQLERALMQYGLDFLRDRGFTEVNPPSIVNEEHFMGSGHFPDGREETFVVKDKDREQYLIGTGEVPLMGLHRDEILDESALPLRLTACTPCFRTEVGSYGKDTHGLFRVRQFTKVEQVVICRADMQESSKLFEEILHNATDFLETLGLPYRIIQYCVGELTLKTYRAMDIETWMPSRNAYGETHTCSELLDFQTRRLRLRYQDRSKTKLFAFSLNNTLVASPRILIPFLENFQQPDGSVTIPSVLRPYVGGERTISVS